MNKKIYATASQLNTVVSGMTVMSFAMFSVPAMDVMAKYLGVHGSVSGSTIAFGRFAVQAISLIAFTLVYNFFAGKKRRMIAHNITGNIARGALMGLAAFSFFSALVYIPVADAIAIFFVEPLILTILSAFLLGEVFGLRRLFAIIIGFAGALFVIQPSFKELGFVSLAPIASAFLYASYLILTRKIASTRDDPLSMQITAGIGGAAIMLIALIIGNFFSSEVLTFKPPQTLFFWLLLVGVGLVGTLTHLMIVWAFARVNASILAPFQYVEIISAALLGYLIFGEFPNALKWLGILIIIISGVYIFWREAQISRKGDHA